MKRKHLFLLAITTGIILSLAWPEIGSMNFLLFIGFIPLLFVEEHIYQEIQNGEKRKLLPYSYLAFLLFNALTTWWVWNASAFGGVAAIVCNALFMSIIFNLFHQVRLALGKIRGYFGLCVLWMGWEYVHLNWDLSWPWLTLGNGFATQYTWVQWYEYTGVFGGSLWILLVNILLFEAFKIYRTDAKKAFSSKAFLTGIAFIALPIIWSLVKYNNYQDQGSPIDVVVIQPNIDPYNEKFGSSSPQQVMKMTKLAEQKMDNMVDYVVAPETAIPQSFDEAKFKHTSEFNILKLLINKYPQSKVIIGASSYSIYEPGAQHSETARLARDQNFWYDFSNTAIQIDAGDSVQFYHKSKLVPGVEKMPFPWLFQHFQDLAFNLGGTTGSLAGQENREAFGNSEDSVRVAPIVCYESIYGDYVGDYINEGDANVFFIITNDGWWKDTPGYKQHMNYARLRAIEHRKSIARSANTGISCFIDQKGDASQETGWWVPAVIRQVIMVNNEKTFYTLYGDYFGRTSLVFGGFLLLYALSRRVKLNDLRR